ncbi:hypothetical protein PYW07_017282 [Mythimna separata]|uniref:Globin domain-containing protein n=1 Tax=Mythimna separata TaxID=271217 RepID=A0AAD7YXG6_MYTSE|nr:hypothetical protein PYW07_017282 [Mythimna separata]
MFIYHWWWGGDPDAVNEVSGMTLRDIYRVQTSWKTINTTQNGFLMFFRLFEAAPETKSFFKSIAKLQTREEMMANVTFRAHVMNVMSALDNSIINLNQPEVVIVWMKKLGDAHERHRIQKRHFWIFKDVLVNILQNDLQFSEDIIASWGKYVTFTYDHMLARMTN